jgi:hypothetical protein
MDPLETAAPFATPAQQDEYDRLRFEWLKNYLSTLTQPQQADYARRCGTSIGYLRKALYSRPLFDGKLCRRLDEESGGAVPRESLRPDVWPLGDPLYGHWVELKTRKGGN